MPGGTPHRASGSLGRGNRLHVLDSCGHDNRRHLHVPPAALRVPALDLTHHAVERHARGLCHIDNLHLVTRLEGALLAALGHLHALLQDFLKLFTCACLRGGLWRFLFNPSFFLRRFCRLLAVLKLLRDPLLHCFFGFFVFSLLVIIHVYLVALHGLLDELVLLDLAIARDVEGVKEGIHLCTILPRLLELLDLLAQLLAGVVREQLHELLRLRSVQDTRLLLVALLPKLVRILLAETFGNLSDSQGP
eukprot:UN1153